MAKKARKASKKTARRGRARRPAASASSTGSSIGRVYLIQVVDGGNLRQHVFKSPPTLYVRGGILSFKARVEGREIHG